ncbi:MAG TPA: ATP-binding protein [Polyangium sp.]|jgi:serine/threonine-protein kinase RsbT|nr:ATP-binding protein [Polyangium sp.]
MNEIAGEVLAILRRYLSDPTSRSLLSSAARRANVRLEMVSRTDVPALVRELGPGLNIFLQEPEKLQNCKSLLALVATENPATAMSSMSSMSTMGGMGGMGGMGSMSGGFSSHDHHPAHSSHTTHLSHTSHLTHTSHQPTETRATDGITVPIRAEHDVVRARTLGKDMAKSLGFSDVDQTKVATAVSELARNIFQYAGTGEVRFRRIEGKRKGIEVVARDQGPGISDPNLILSGQYRSKWGMGAGLRGTKRLVDDFELDTVPGHGTTVRIRKYIN